MTRLAISIILSIIGNAIGLMLASFLFSDFTVNLWGFVVSVAFFTVSQVVLSPLMLKLAVKYLPAIRGGIALVTVFVALFLTVVFTDGIAIGSLSTWLMSPLVIWISTVIAGVVLPTVLFKKAIASNNGSTESD